jgi:hypothetical protein
MSDAVNSSDQFFIRVPRTGKMYTVSAYSPDRKPAWIRSARAALGYWVERGGGDGVCAAREKVHVKMRGAGDGWEEYVVD